MLRLAALEAEKTFLRSHIFSLASCINKRHQFLARNPDAGEAAGFHREVRGEARVSHQASEEEGGAAHPHRGRGRVESGKHHQVTKL